MVRAVYKTPFMSRQVFSRDKQRANRIASQIRAGMSSINDFATTYLCAPEGWQTSAVCKDASDGS